VLVAAAAASPARAVDEPVIQVSAGRAVPARLEVHVGERVRWRGPSGQRVQIELDPHRDAHEVVVREGEIQAVFLATGEHWYRGALLDGGRQSFRGVVVVGEVRAPVDQLPICSSESSYRVCFAP
jgi:plastocyanin